MHPPDASTPAVRVEVLSVADVGEVLTLQRAAYVTEAQLHDDLALPALVQTLDQLRAELSERDVIALGVREGPRLLASGRVRQDNDRAEIGRLSVAPDRQGEGLGTLLLRELEARLPPSVTRISLFTGERSTANQRLYARCGYVETHRSDLGAYQLVHMAKNVIRP